MAISVAAPALASQGLPSGHSLAPNDTVGDDHAPTRVHHTGPSLSLISERRGDGVPSTSSSSRRSSLSSSSSSAVVSGSRGHTPSAVAERCTSAHTSVDEDGPSNASAHERCAGEASTSASAQVALSASRSRRGSSGRVDQARRHPSSHHRSRSRAKSSIDHSTATAAPAAADSNNTTSSVPPSSDSSPSSTSSSSNGNSSTGPDRRGGASAAGPRRAARKPGPRAGGPSAGADNPLAARGNVRDSQTLEELQQRSAELRPLDIATLRQRLAALAVLTGTDDEQRQHAGAVALAAAVPALLLAEPPALVAALRGVREALGADEPAARAAVRAAPLLLVLPPSRLPDTLTTLRQALRVSHARAARLCARLPQLATLAPATLASKLAGLRRLLGPSATSHDLAAALDAAPRLLTFSTAALEKHHASLVAMLGPGVVAAALRREPRLLAHDPANLLPKLRLLVELLGCRQQPAAVALLVCRHPGVLRRSLTALSRCCRALSIWRLHPRAKLHMCLARRSMLALPPLEVHGRCRWLRRLMLSNAYYHAALRRLPPAVLARLVTALPGGWARLQYLADSSQEGCIDMLEAAECKQAEFEKRFPEFSRWLAWKLRQMGANNPWRGAYRIRGIGTPAKEKTAQGGAKQPGRLAAAAGPGSRPGAQAAGAGPQSPPAATVPVVVQEAGEVRSGGSTVARPRRIVHQALEPPAQPAQLEAPAAAAPPRPQPPQQQQDPGDSSARAATGGLGDLRGGAQAEGGQAASSTGRGAGPVRPTVAADTGKLRPRGRQRAAAAAGAVPAAAAAAPPPPSGLGPGPGLQPAAVG